MLPAANLGKLGGAFVVGSVLRLVAWIVGVLILITLVWGPVPPYPGCKPICSVGKASGDSSISQSDVRRKPWGTACNSVETYPNKVASWWFPATGPDESVEMKRAIAIVVFAMVMLSGVATSARSAFNLEAFSSEDPVYERRGAPPQSLAGLFKSWRKVFVLWLEKSRAVIRDLAAIIGWGYIVPSVLFTIFIVFSPWFLNGHSFLVPASAVGSERSQSLLPPDEAASYVVHQFSSAALFGAPEAFGWREPNLKHNPENLASAVILQVFFFYVSWLGSLSITRVLLVLAWNLLDPCIYKFNKYAKYKQSLGSSALLPAAEDVPVAA